MATANVGLQFTADKGLPTLQQVLKALQDIKKATAEKIDIKISTNVEKTGQSLTVVANGLKKVKEANLQEKDIQKIERLNNIFKAENSSKMNQFGKSLSEVAKGLSKLANADSEKLARNLDMIKSNLNAISKINLSNLNSLGNITNLTSNVRNLTGTSGASSQAKEPTGNKSMLSITEYMARYAGAYAAFNIGKASLVELYDFEKAITQIGIAGEMSQTQIQSLRYEYGKLATESGISAKEIAMAGEVIIKTGQSLSDTNLILKEAIKLSKATGDSLSYTAESLSKILLTLQISAEHVTDVTNMMMSVANKTPASMQSLQEGLKQSNAGFANFAESTTKSGEALEEYKLKLIQTELAMMGGLAQLGRKGEQTGTSIRQLSIKMSTMEKTATNLFNAEMKLKNIFVEVDKTTGKLNITNGETANSFALTSEMLSNLANEDAPKAIELLSKLYSNGQLSMTTLNKMFTIQHAPYLTQVLTQINGDMDEYNKKMTTGSTVTQAYDQSMESWANQFDRMRQGLSMSNVLISDFVNILGGTVLKPIADFGEGLSKIYTGSQILNTTIKSLISTLIATVGAWKAYSISMSFVKGMQEAFVVNTIASTNAVVAETVAIEGATVATKGFGLALKTVAPFVAIFAGFEIFNFIMESMKKAEEQALKSADANNAFAKSLSDTFKNIKDYRSQIKETQDTTNKLRAENLFKDWNNINDVVDKVIGKFDKLKSSQEAINKLTILYANKQDYFANIPKLRGEKQAETAIVAGQPIKYDDVNMNEQDLRDRLGSKRLELTSLYNQYLETGKGQEKINTLLKNSGIVFRDVQAYYNSMAKAQEEYTKQTEEATKQTLIFESSVKDLLSIQAQNIKEFKFELIGDAINKSNIKNVQEFTETLTNFGLGSYVTRLGNVKDAFSGIVTESGKVDVLKNNLLPLVSGLSTIDNIIASTNKNIELAKGIEGQEQRVKEQKELVSLLEQQKDRMIKNALIEKTHVGIREKVSQSYQSELFNLQKVGKGKWEQLQIDKKTLEFTTKLQEELDKNKLDSLSNTVNKEFRKTVTGNITREYSPLELEEKLNELNAKAGNLTKNEAEAQKLILEYKNAQDVVEANKIKAQIQALQYQIQEKDLQIEINRLGVDFNNLTKTNLEIEAGNTQRAYEDWQRLSEDKNKSMETEMALYKYRIQLLKEGKAIDESNKAKYNISQDIKEQLDILKSIGKESSLKSDIDKIRLNTTRALVNLTEEERSQGKDSLIIAQGKTKEAEAEYNWRMKTNKLLFESKMADVGIMSYGFKSSPEEEYKARLFELSQMSQSGQITESEQIIENHKAEIKLLQDKIDLTKELYSNIASNIDKISKGEFSSTPSYDLSRVTGKLANRKEFGKTDLNKFTGKDYAQMANFAITQFSNVWGTINSKHIESINNEITMLDMRKELATSDEERQRIDKEILDKKIEVIKLESQTKQQQSIMGGITGGIGTMAAGGFNPVSIGLGIVQMGMGIFGASEEKKKAKIQEKQLKEQERIRIEAEKQTKFMEQQQKFYQTWLQYSYSGINYGLNKAFQSSPFKTTRKAFAEDAKGGDVAGVATISTTSYIDFLNKWDENKKELNRLQNKNDESLINLYNIEELKKTLAEFEKEDAKYTEQKKIIHSSYFDWELKQYVATDQAVKDGLAKAGTYYKEEWKKREDIMNQFVENAKTGANTIAEYMGDYVTNSIISAWTRNRTSLNKILTSIETNVTKLSDYMSENIGMNLSDLFKANALSPDTGEYYNTYLTHLILNFKDLSKEQTAINEQSSQLVNYWIQYGGAISDVMLMLPQFSKDLYNAVGGALEQTSFVERFNTIGQALSSSIVEKLKKNLMDTSLKNTFLSLNDEITKIMTGGDTSISDIVSLSSRIAQASASMQGETDRMRAKLDLLNMNTDVEYKSAQNNIQYSSGTTSTVNNSYNIQITQDIGSVLNMDKTDRVTISNQLADTMVVAIESKIGKIAK